MLTEMNWWASLFPKYCYVWLDGRHNKEGELCVAIKGIAEMTYTGLKQWDFRRLYIRTQKLFKVFQRSFELKSVATTPWVVT